ncbi:hypothetical protein [Oerskovia flava]|uniref:hypothetical protein n=1 Tax=Oerskovia flava TaxID=2986422 RepID=UPI002240738E|nr:hypothetical protein [Oerskovia sp. JB1-3-2]
MTDGFLLALASIAATLLGAFILAVFFYLNSALHRARGAAGRAHDRYIRAGVRWVLIAYSLPLIVALALVGAEPVWAAVSFLVFATALVVATVDTSRRIVQKGAARRSLALAANEILTSLAVVAVVALPWILGGWIPASSDFAPSLLLALAIGFTSTAAVIMSVFDADEMSAHAPEPAAPLRRSATRLRRRS